LNGLVLSGWRTTMIDPSRIASECLDDAEKWAEAFKQIVLDRGLIIDEDLMIGWFANAIEVAHDHRVARTKAMERLAQEWEHNAGEE